MSISKHFNTLGLKSSASKDEIKKAYRQKAKIFHPDINPSPAAAQMFMKVNIAYEILMDYKEGGAPTYTTSAPAPDSTNTKFHGSKFTHSQMKDAWAKQRQREREAYEAYLNLPWYSGVKLEEYFLRFIGLFFAIILIGPLFLLFLALSIGLLYEGHVLGGIMSFVFMGGFGFAIYRIVKISLSK